MLYAIEEVDERLQSAVRDCLRPDGDEATLLPQAHRSSESQAFKNVVFRLDARAPVPRPTFLSPTLFEGVSAIAIDEDNAQRLLGTREARERAMATMAAHVPSEIASADVEVGPELADDDSERDASAWQCGFDSDACCVGIYVSEEAVSSGVPGMRRLCRRHYLVCKAGGGKATAEFRQRLDAALRGGASLDAALHVPGGSPGPKALRRAQRAAERNRGRVLALVADALGLGNCVVTVPDLAAVASHPRRLVVCAWNVSYSTLRREQTSTGTWWVHASGCVDGTLNCDVLSSSNVSEGFVLFGRPEKGRDTGVHNTAWNCVPFGSPRLLTDAKVLERAAEAHAAALVAAGESGSPARPARAYRQPNARAHPDFEWIAERFGWVDEHASSTPVIEPPVLWGSFDSHGYTMWARELGLEQRTQTRLCPELVLLAGHDHPRLRAAQTLATTLAAVA
jgi:hypothetical protein